MHIGFHDQQHWVVTYFECSRFFVAALPELVGDGAILYLESYKKRMELRSYLTPHRAPASVVEPVSTGSADPLWIEHLSLSPEFVAAIESYYTHWYQTLGEHLHCYRAGKLLFWFHDAFTGGHLQISADIPEESVARFCRAMAPKHALVFSESNPNT